MIGSDQKELAKKRLTHVLKHRKLSIHSDFDKYFILKIMTEEMSLFRWWSENTYFDDIYTIICCY